MQNILPMPIHLLSLLFLLLLIPTLITCSCLQERSDKDRNISADLAVDIVIKKVLKGNVKDKNIFLSPQLVRGGERIRGMAHLYIVPKDLQFAWFVFIDDMPTANWEHPCRYVFVDLKTGKCKVFGARAPPDNLNTFKKVKE